MKFNPDHITMEVFTPYDNGEPTLVRSYHELFTTLAEMTKPHPHDDTVIPGQSSFGQVEIYVAWYRSYDEWERLHHDPEFDSSTRVILDIDNIYPPK